MDLPVIRLRAFSQKEEPIASEESASSSIPLAKYSSEVILASGINLLMLVGLFSIVFGSTLFFVQNTGGGVFAKIPGKFLASVAGALGGTKEATTTNEVLPVDVVLYKDPFESIGIEGKAAYVFDVASGKTLYEKNKNAQMPLASITKVMTALVATDILPGDDTVTIKESDLLADNPVDLTVGETWHVKDLLDFTLVTSSNNGASVLARAAGQEYLKDATSSFDADASPKDAFIQKMNEKAKFVGMTSTIFHNESGLDISGSKSGGYASAEDVALLYRFVLANKPDLLDVTRQAKTKVVSADDVVHSAKNTNQWVASFPGLLASKTGYTDLAGGNLAVVFDSGMGTPIVVVVLGSSTDGRFSDVGILSQAAREAVGQGIF